MAEIMIRVAFLYDEKQSYVILEEEIPILEFQEGFFEQEIREGFYVDKSMKAAWAPEMEVLQKVAEICDRRGYFSAGLSAAGGERANTTREARAYLEEIWEGIQYLEANCGVKISHQLVIEENGKSLPQSS